jgi:mRNA interferase MazF
MVTSAGRSLWESDVPIPDHAQAGLPAPSLVRTAKITTTEASRVLRRSGRLPVATAARVRAAIAGNLG